MERPNTLPPTLREIHRYLAYQVVSESRVPFPELTNTIWGSILSFLGELGAAKANVWIIKDTYDEEKQIGLIRCNHTSVEQVRSALALISRIGDTRVIVKVLGISGTMKAARKKFFGEVDLENFTQ